MSKKGISLEKIMNSDEVVSYLENLITCFKDRKIVVEQGEQFISLTLPETVSVEIEAAQKKDKGKFSLELSWKNKEPEAPEQSLKISSKEPEPPPEPEESSDSDSEKASSETTGSEKLY